MADKYALHIYPKAIQDIDGILDYIANQLHNPTAAIKLIDDFESALETVCTMPLCCPLANNEYVKEKNLRKLSSIITSCFIGQRQKQNRLKFSVFFTA